MSFFPRAFYSEDPSFTNLFRLLDDFDSYSRGSQRNGQGRHQGRQTALFNPKFDVRETEKSFELHGELPGIERENVNIEFTEPQVMVISGRVERNYSAGTPPASLVENTQVTDHITEAGEKPSHKATVTDEATEEAAASGQATPEETPKTQVAELAAAPKQPAERFWHQERTIGQFTRTFNFPTRVDDSGVKANLNNGILHVSVPKAVKHEARRISVL